MCSGAEPRTARPDSASMNSAHLLPLDPFKEFHQQYRRRDILEPVAVADDSHDPHVPCRVQLLQPLGRVSDALRQAAAGEIAEAAFVGDDAFAVVHVENSAKELMRGLLKVVDALLRGDHNQPAVRVVRMSDSCLASGVLRITVDGVKVPVFNPAKTVADCFKYRNKIGLDVALEALKDAWRRRLVRMDDLTRFARINRVERVMQPYLEMLVA